MAYLEVILFKHAQERSVVSKFLSEYYSKFGEVQIIPNAVSTDIFNNPNASIIQNIRMKLNIPYDSRVFIMACDLITRKDPELVIKAFSKANIPNSLLLILGHGTLLKIVKELPIAMFDLLVMYPMFLIIIKRQTFLFPLLNQKVRDCLY